MLPRDVTSETVDRIAPIDRLDCGKYTIIARSGTTTLTEHYLAVCNGPSGFRKAVDVERLRPPWRSDPETTGALVEAAHLGARLQHPSNVDVVDVMYIGREPLIVTEHLESRTLEEVLLAARQYHEPMPHALVVDVFVAVTSYLADFHALRSLSGAPIGARHGRLTPDCILLGFAGFVKVRRPAMAGREGAGVYEAPEESPDQRADIYTAGVSFLTALVGRPVVGGDDGANDLTRRWADPRHPSPHLSRILSRALSPDPTQRYATALAMHEDLKQLRQRMRHPGCDLETYLRALFTDTIRAQDETVRTLIHRSTIPPPSADLTDSPALPRRPSRRWAFAAAFATAVLAGVLAAAFPAPDAEQADERSPDPPTSEAIPHGPQPADIAERTVDPPRRFPAPAVASEREEDDVAPVPVEEPLPTWWTEAVHRLKYGEDPHVTGVVPRPERRVRPQSVPRLSDAPRPTDLALAPRDLTPAPGPTGHLTLVTRPWSNVSIGPHFLGTTPVFHVELPEGRHVLTLRNPEHGIVTNVGVVIVAGAITKKWFVIEGPRR